MREIVLQLRAPRTWVSEVTEKHPSTVRILDCKPSESKDGIRQLVEVTADPEGVEKIVKEVKASPLVKEAYIVETKKGKMIGSLLTSSVFCGMIMGSNAFCRTCFFQTKSRPDGTVEWTIAFTEGEALTELLDRLKEEKVESLSLKLIESSSIQARPVTDVGRSDHLLEEGYFD